MRDHRAQQEESKGQSYMQSMHASLVSMVCVAMDRSKLFGLHKRFGDCTCRRDCFSALVYLMARALEA